MKTKRFRSHLLMAVSAGFASALLMTLPGCRKSEMSQPSAAQNGSLAKQGDKIKAKKNFEEIRLVANTNTYGAARVDPLLINAWGLAWNPTGIAWISAADAGVSVVYNSDGGQVRPAVNIPSPTGPAGGHPTGQVFSGSTTDFLLPAPNGQPARFIFAEEDGVISAWNGAAGNNAVLIVNNASTAVYTGLAIGTYNNANYLYAANFKTGHIDVFDKMWNTVSMPFTDASLPSGYAPFNVQNIDGSLYVMYAKVAADGEEEAGDGLGFVDIYTTGGTLVKRFVSGGQLNAPWGITRAPSGFFDDGTGLILVGNFGNGRINAYKSDGSFFGELWLHDAPIEIEGLWAISATPATATSIAPNRVYFTAGPNDESDGLFGYIQRKE
jgi:uncharacterized protein (TIGR03118 family)